MVSVGLSLQGCLDPGGGDLAVVPHIAPVVVTSSFVAMASCFYRLWFVKGVVDAVLDSADAADAGAALRSARGPCQRRLDRPLASLDDVACDRCSM